MPLPGFPNRYTNIEDDGGGDGGDDGGGDGGGGTCSSNGVVDAIRDSDAILFLMRTSHYYQHCSTAQDYRQEQRGEDNSGSS